MKRTLTLTLGIAIVATTVLLYRRVRTPVSRPDASLDSAPHETPDSTPDGG